jgi:hypothetical protein
VRRSVLPAGLLVGTFAADTRDAHSLSLYLLLLAVPVLAFAALGFFGELVDGTADENVGALYVGLSALALLLVLVSAAARANAYAGVPAIASSAVVGALGLLAIQSLVWCSGRLSRATILAMLRALS